MPEPNIQASRVGHVRLGSGDGKLFPATLDHEEHGGVVIRIPYLVDKFPERWFWDGHSLHIGPDSVPIAPERPPSELDYFDHEGSVGLVGCRRRRGGGMRFGAYSTSCGVGLVSAQFAVTGARRATNYQKINGFRSEIDGLGQWLNVSAHHTTMKLPKDGTAPSVTTTTTNPPDLQLARPLGLSATVRGTAPTPFEPDALYTSTALLQTYSTSAEAWAVHIHLHEAVRDLMRVAIWKPVAFQRYEATSDHERVTWTNGDAPRSVWCEVKTAVPGFGGRVWGMAERPLITFADIDHAGIERWLEFYDTNQRGLRPFLRLLDIREGTVEEHVTQLGIAVEALGYQAFRDSGLDSVKADRQTLKARMGKIAAEVEGCIPPVPPTFSQDFADSYNAVKHANRQDPGPTELLFNHRLGVTIIRAWIALRLGVPEAIIAERIG